MKLEVYGKNIHLTTPVGLFVAGVPMFEVDDLLVPLVLDIWETGGYTAACCQGGPPTDPRLMEYPSKEIEGYMAWGGGAYHEVDVALWVERQGWRQSTTSQRVVGCVGITGINV